jgi:predicted phosphodiesterase
MYRRIGVIGDVHAHHGHLALALDYLTAAGVDVVICTGDIMDGVGEVDACVSLLQQANVLTVRGNHDRWVLQDKARHVPHAHHLRDLSDTVIDYLKALPVQQHLDTVAGPLLLCHGVADDDLRKVWPGTERMAAERSQKLDGLIEQGHLAFMINGHMHYRTLIHFHGLTLLNAGTIRGDHRPGFSLLDLDERLVHGFELFAEAAQKVQHVKTLRLAAEHHSRVFKNTSHFDDQWDPVTLYA